MQVGTLSSDRTSFDITEFDETNSVLAQTESSGVTTTRWLYHDEESRMIELRRQADVGTVLEAGSKIKLSSVAGVGTPTLCSDNAVAVLLVDLDFQNHSFQTKQVVLDGVETTAVLAPVRLIRI